RMIYSSQMDGERPKPVTTSKIFPLITALAFNWYSKLLYMASNDERKITVVRINSRDLPQRVIANDTEGIHGIALDPSEGLVFYTVIKRPAKIYRMLSDGSNRYAIVSRELGTPYHITCDYLTKRLYWTDGVLSRIQYSDYSGRNVQTLKGKSISHPFGIAIYEFTHPCRQNNGECADFCFPIVERGRLTRVCGCRYGKKIDPAANSDCIDNSAIEPTITNCEGKFRCNNGRCIPI
ncbi:unnamed protein product, partial [Didymodactylos carnosus]